MQTIEQETPVDGLAEAIASAEAMASPDASAIRSVDPEIEDFLTGHHPMPYVSAMETDYYSALAKLVIDDPDTGKRIEQVSFKPFVYVKDLAAMGIKLTYTAQEKQNAITYHQIGFRRLSVTDGHGNDHPRLAEGFRYLFYSRKSYNDLLAFFRKGGLDVYKDRGLFYTLPLNEQFLVQTGMRFFKGMDTYDQVHKLYFDIETSGLNPATERIFLIGLSDNRGYRRILGVERPDCDESERKVIRELFAEIIRIAPSIVAGYNSEAFDFHFILERAQILGLRLMGKDAEVKTTLSDKHWVRRKETSLKLGGETEFFEQTIIWGMSVIDVSHAVRRAKAINSDIKEWGLKYITKYKELNKPDRVYINGSGGDIYRYWSEDKWFAIRPADNSYTQVPEALQSAAATCAASQPQPEDGYFVPDAALLAGGAWTGSPDWPAAWRTDAASPEIRLVRGAWLIERYLLDDLWETQAVDEAFNQDTFLITKLVPVTFARKNTMGNSAKWNLLMTAWSYLGGLAIPVPAEMDDFVGGLSRLFRIGFSRHIQKLDFSGLYPSIKLTYNAFPSCDVTGVLFRFLRFFTATRSQYKYLASDESPLPAHERSMYGTRQLPFKIFNNSEFGATGSVYFNWGELDVAEFTTCSGRQYLRKAIWFFSRWGCIPLVCDTDGINFSIPPTTPLDINGGSLPEPLPFSSLSYTDREGKTHEGVKAILAKYNTEQLFGEYMKVDDDGKWVSTINLARKNYLNLTEKGKIKYTGNTIKSSNREVYIEEFIQTAAPMLLRGDTREFVDYYQTYASGVFHGQVPLRKIANKAKIKSTVTDYLLRGRTINGQVKAQMAHMELIMETYFPPDVLEQVNALYKKHYTGGSSTDSSITETQLRQSLDKLIGGIHIPHSMGQTVYYVNTGTSKSHGDSKRDKEGGLMSQFINAAELERNPDMRGNYNAVRYLDKLNSLVESFLIVFQPRVRATLLLTPVKEGRGKQARVVLPPLEYYTDGELEPVSYDQEQLEQLAALLPKDKKIDPEKNLDTIKEVMTMSDREVTFWNRVKINPLTMFDRCDVPDNLWVFTYNRTLASVNRMLAAANADYTVLSAHLEYPFREPESPGIVRYLETDRDGSYHIRFYRNGTKAERIPLNGDKLKKFELLA